MKAYFIFFLLVFIFAPAQATKPTVISAKFYPEGYVNYAKQFKVVFNQSITAAQNNQNALQPVTSNCFTDGSGYWTDSKTWVYNFSNSPSPDIKCTIQAYPEFIQAVYNQSKIKMNLKASWFQTQSVLISQSWPSDGSTIDAEQIFFIKTNTPVSNDWINKNVYFLIKGIGNKIPVVVFSKSETQNLFNQLKKEKAIYDEDDEATNIVALKPAKALPRSSQVELQWVNSYAFNIEPDFTAKLSCERETAESGCLPLSDIFVNFSQPISGDNVSKIYLQTEDGQKILPYEAAYLNNKHTYSSIRFLNPFLEKKNYILVIGKIKSVDNENLLNASSFPLKIKTDNLPSLLKVDSQFSVIEKDYAFLPVTVRHEQNGIQVMDYSKNISGQKSVLDLKNVGSIISLYDKAKSYTYDDTVIKNSKPFEYILKTNPDKKTEVVGIPLKTNGVHFMEFKSQILGKKLNYEPENKPYFYVRNLSLVTDLSLLLKYVDGQYIVWVTSLKTGLPIQNATVYLYSKKADLISQMKTNTNGLAEFNLTADQIKKLHLMSGPYSKENFFVFTEFKDDFSFLDSSQNEGLEKYRFSLNLPYENQKEIFHAILEKNLLKPNEILKGKLIYRSVENTGLNLKRSSWPQKVYFKSFIDDKKFSVSINWEKSSGVATFEWPVPSGSPMGKYILSLNEKEFDQIGEFSIENFKVPLLDVKFNALRTPWVADQSKTLQISAKYLNGGFAVGLPIKLRYSLASAYLNFDDEFSNFTWSEGPVKTGLKNYSTDEEDNEPLTDRQFKQIDLKISENGINEVQLDAQTYRTAPQQLIVTAEYKDANGEYQSVSRAYDWYSSNYFIGLKNDTWSINPANGKITAQLLNLQKDPVSDKIIQFKLYKIDSFSTRKKLIGGFYTFDSYDNVEFVKNLCETKTNMQGIAQCTLNDSKLFGDYFIEAVATDSTGFKAITHRRLYVSKTQSLAEETSDRVDLLPNKRIYKPGDVAEFKLVSSISSGQILLTVESNNILHKEIIKYSNDNPIIKLKIKPEWAPNVVIAAHLIRGRLKTIDPLKVGEIDLAKPSLKVGMTNIFIDKDKYTLDIKVKTNQSIYQPHDNVTSTITVTDHQGRPINEGELAIAVIDEGLLKLRPNLSWNLLDVFYPIKPDAIESAYLMTSVLGRRTFGLKAVPIGGDGRSTFGAREAFDTSLYWNPRIPIKNGQAQVKFKTNDSLTSYRIVAIAQSKADLFGTGYETIKISKDIQAFSELPLAVRNKDFLNLNYSIYNSKNTPQNLKALIKVNGIDVGEKNLRIESKKTEHLSWPYDFKKINGDKAKIQLILVDKDKIVDRMINSIDILDTYRARVVFSDFQNSKKIQFNVSPNSLSEKKSDLLTVSVDPTLLTENIQSKKYFDDLCFESLETEIAKAIATNQKSKYEKIIKKLKNYQDSEGYLSRYPVQQGISNSGSQNGDMSVTNFILQIVHFKGWEVPKDIQDKALNALHKSYENKIVNSQYLNDRQKLALRLDTLFTLHLYKKASLHDGQLLKLKNINLSNISLATALYLTLPPALLPNSESLKNQLLDELENRKAITPTNISFKNLDTSSFYEFESQKFLFLLLAQSINNPTLKNSAGLLLKALWPPQSYKLYFNFKDITWMNLGLMYYKKFYEKTEAKGLASINLGQQSTSAKVDKSIVRSLPINQKSNYSFNFEGQGIPWVTTLLTTNQPPQKDEFHGLTVKKSWIPVTVKKTNAYSVGDIWKIKISIKSHSKVNWLTVLDPLPAGATIIDDVYATYSERRLLDYRFVIDELNTDEATYEYTIRLNQSGVFQIATSRVEAQYEPSLYAEIINKEIIIEN